MPKVTKDIEKDNLESKKSTTKKATTTTKKTTTSKASTSTKAKTTKSKKETTVAKKTTTTKKAPAKKKSVSKTKKIDSPIIAEYYDLPYRYNETIVKILYQTPNVLFVYWDISDDDRNKFIAEYGEDFFNRTRPVLKIFNTTKNYSFEIEINDFANSWYINVNEPNCDYKVELSRKPIDSNSSNSDYIYVSSSNNIEIPNDHILLEELPNNINFKNVKTNKVTTKNIGTMRLIGINKFYNVHDFYKKLYKDEILNEINNSRIINPSSSWN